jgi:tRNA A37 methylthiotransferase MiaB
MKRVLYAFVLALSCTIAASAQSGAAAQEKEKPAKAAADKSVAVTGCVAEADGHFMLNNATTADQTTPMSFALSGGTLKPHVGHKVEVTGTMKPMAKDSTKTDTMAKDKMAKPDTAMAGTITVKDVKMIAASCS